LELDADELTTAIAVVPALPRKDAGAQSTRFPRSTFAIREAGRAANTISTPTPRAVAVVVTLGHVDTLAVDTFLSVAAGR